MAELKVRQLQPADLDRVSEIEFKIAGLSRRPFFEKYLAQAVINPRSFITCGVEDGGKLAGFTIARVREGDFGSHEPVAILESIGVIPGVQGKGIGKMMIAEIERQMKAKGIPTVRTQAVWTDRALTGFFGAAGFKIAPIYAIERAITRLPETSEDALARDRVLVRSLMRTDLPGVVRIDTKLTGDDHSAYYTAKFQEVLEGSGIRISVVSEDDGIVIGFIMARLDYGEFGQVEKQAVLDALGVHPAFAGNGIGHALLAQLLLNLANLNVESIRTQVSWENFKLQRFLAKYDFHPSQRLVLTKSVANS